jgi:hypothetical protein
MDQQSINNILNQLNHLTMRVNEMEEKLAISNQPIQLRHFYYNNLPNNHKYIYNESKLFVNRFNNIGQNMFNELLNNGINNNMLPEYISIYNRLINNFEYIDNDMIDFVNMNRQIIIPENKMIKVWINTIHPVVYIPGTYNSNIFANSIFIWMGSNEYSDDLPNNLLNL